MPPPDSAVVVDDDMVVAVGDVRREIETVELQLRSDSAAATRVAAVAAAVDRSAPRLN